jgi:hypothetical protein
VIVVRIAVHNRLFSSFCPKLTDKAKSQLVRRYVGYRFVPSLGQLLTERMEVGFVSHFRLPL